MRWLGYHRAWTVLKVGLLAAPLAPLVAPLVGGTLARSTALTPRIATILSVALLLVFVVRAMRRSPREALGLVASTAGAALIAAYIVAARDNAFFVADLLYEAAAALLAGASVSAALRGVQPPLDNARGTRWVAAQRAVADMVTRVSAWLLMIFWMCVAVGLRYVSAGVLFLLAGLIAVTMLLRLAEFAATPKRRRLPE